MTTLVIVREEGGAYERVTARQWVDAVRSSVPIFGVMHRGSACLYDRILARFHQPAIYRWPGLKAWAI